VLIFSALFGSRKGIKILLSFCDSV